MRSASIWLLCKTRIIEQGALLHATRRKAFIDLVLEKARRRGRSHELAMDLGRNSAVLDQLAVAELDLPNMRLRVVAGRADLARVDAFAFHVALLSHSSSCGLPMLDHQLQVLHPVELIDREPVRRAHGRGQGIERVEVHGFDGAAGARELELQVFLADHALAEHLELVAEHRLRKTLSPDLGVEQLREAQIEIRGFERTVGLDRARKLRGREQLARHGFEAFREAREIRRAQRQSRGGGVPAKAQEQVRFALRDEIQSVAQMQAENGAARAADLAGAGRGEGEGRAVVAILDAPGENAHYALVPARVIQADAGGVAHRELRHQEIGLRLHAGFDRAPLAVEVVELPRDIEGAPAIVRYQALDPQAHIGQTSGRVEPRPEQKSEIESARARRIAAGSGKEGAHAFLHAARADAPQALRDQDAIVEIEWHDVCDRAERDKVEHAA